MCIKIYELIHTYTHTYTKSAYIVGRQAKESYEHQAVQIILLMDATDKIITILIIWRGNGTEPRSGHEEKNSTSSAQSGLQFIHTFLIFAHEIKFDSMFWLINAQECKDCAEHICRLNLSAWRRSQLIQHHLSC